MTQDILQKAKECWSEAEEAFEPTRKRMLEDLRFSNPAEPEQWDESVKRARENSVDGARPCLTFDQTNQYIAQVVNDSRQNKPGIKVLPVDSGADVDVAERLEGMVRHIEYSSRASIAYDTAQEYAARIGLGWMRVVPEIVNPETNEQEIRIKRVHDPLAVLADPNMTEPDGADMGYGFVATSLGKKAFQKAYPKAATQSWEADGWFSQDTVRICEYLYKKTTTENRLVIEGPDGQRMTVTEDEYWALAKQTGFQPQVVQQFMAEAIEVQWVKMTGAEVLEETTFPSRFIPLVPVLGCELWVEGKRYLCGLTRRMMDPQRAYNYERTSYIETVALQTKTPWTIPWESVEEFQDEWGGANRRNLAYLPYNAIDTEGRQLPPPQRNSPPAMPASFVQGGAIAINDIQASIGMYKSNLGAPSNAVSGRAKQQDQREGDTANYHYIDNLSRGIEQLGRVIVDMIPRIYDTKRIARICGDDGTNDFVEIDPDQPEAKVKKQVGDKSRVTINPTVGTYDVRVKAGPSYTTMRQESAEALGNLLERNPTAFAVLGPEWAKMQDWPNADKISKMLLSMAPPAVQKMAEGDTDIPAAAQAQMAQLQEQNQKLTQALEQATQHIESGAAEARVKAESDDKDRLIEAYKAETERLKVTAPAMGPAEVQAIVGQVLQQILSTPQIPPPEAQQMAAPPDPGPPPMPPDGMQQPVPQEPPHGGFSLPA